MASPALIHSYDGGTSGTGVFTVSATTSVSSSNSLILLVQIFGPSSTSHGTVTDTGTGTWTNVSTLLDSGDSVQFETWACNNPGATTHVVSYTPAAADAYGAQGNLMEWSNGPFTFDNGYVQDTASGTTGATPTIQPIKTGELLFASAATDAVGDWTTPTNGFTGATTYFGANNPVAYLLDPKSQKISCSWSISPADGGVTAIVALLAPSSVYYTGGNFFMFMPGAGFTAGSTLELTNIPNQTGTVGTPYAYKLSATGGTPSYSYSAASLPAGLSVSGASITGTPTTAQTKTSQVTVTDSTTPTPQTASQSFTFTVSASVGGGLHGVYQDPQGTWSATPGFALQTGATISINSQYVSQVSWAEMESNAAGVLGEISGMTCRLALAVPMVPGPGGSFSAAATGGADNATCISTHTSIADAIISQGFGPSSSYGAAIVRLGYELNIGTTTAISSDPTNFVNVWNQVAPIYRNQGILIDFNTVPNAGYDFEPYLTEIMSNVDVISSDAYDQDYSYNPNNLPTDASTTWNNILDATYDGLTQILSLATSNGKYTGLPEWGVVNKNDGHGLGDDPYYIEHVAAWIADNQPTVLYDSYYNNNTGGGGEENSVLAAFPNSSAAYIANIGHMSATSPLVQQSVATAVGTLAAIQTGPIVGITPNSVSSSNSLVLVAQIFGPNSATHGTISDTAGGTWSNLYAAQDTGGATQFELWVCNNPSAAVHTVTFTPAAADTYGAQIFIMEFNNGPFTFDKGAVGDTSSGSTGATPTITPANTGELLIAAAATDVGSAWLTPNNGFTALMSQCTNPMAYKIDAAATSISCTWNLNPDDSGVAAIMALIPG